MTTPGQQIELSGGWRNAWRHEVRAPDGRWVHGAGAALEAPAHQGIVNRLSKLPGARYAEDRHLGNAIKALRDGDDQKAADSLSSAFEYAYRITHESTNKSVVDDARVRVAAYKDAIAALNPGGEIPGDSPEIERIHEWMQKNVRIVPALFGDNTALYWNGKPPEEFSENEHPGALAQMGWDGQMFIEENTAKELTAILDKPGETVDDPDPLIVPLHEMIHAVEPKGEHEKPNEFRADDSIAYNEKDSSVRAIEEGFTQLGTAQHAEEFFKTTGVADRKTRFPVDNADQVFQDKQDQVMASLGDLAGELEKDGRPPETQEAGKIRAILRDLRSDEDIETIGDAVTRVRHLGDPHYTERARDIKRKLDDMYEVPNKNVGEWARDMASPQRIRNGTSWQHYNQWTADAYNFSAYIAVLDGGKEDPEKIGWIADQINSQGTAGKVRHMAALIFSTMGYRPGTITDSTVVEAIGEAEDIVKHQWKEGHPQVTIDLARKKIRQVIKKNGEGAKP